MTLYGDCLEKLKTLSENSVDSVITDPPAGISFMGKEWDDDKGGRKQWIAWMESVMRECLRVLKPGGHALVWAIPRTSHWTATAVEDAGFEVRDVVTHLFGSGFPKSLNIEKATDGAVKGQGTALKPAAEFWILARKPLSEKTVAKNVLKWGTGGLNIDASRIGYQTNEKVQTFWNNRGGATINAAEGVGTKPKTGEDAYDPSKGRFPANLVLSGDAPEMLDEQVSKTMKMHSSGSFSYRPKRENIPTSQKSIEERGELLKSAPLDSGGGASRFFYCAKVSPSERGEDNKHPTVKPLKLMKYLITLITSPGGIVLDPFMGSGSTGVAAKETGFRFIGIEQEKEYFEISQKRIEATV